MMEAHARGMATRPYDMSYSSKIMCIIAEYIGRNYQNKFYAKGLNLTNTLTMAYDQALKTYDVLIMPTLPMKPLPLPTENDNLKGNIFHLNMFLVVFVCALMMRGRLSYKLAYICYIREPFKLRATQKIAILVYIKNLQ